MLLLLQYVCLASLLSEPEVPSGHLAGVFFSKYALFIQWFCFVLLLSFHPPRKPCPGLKGVTFALNEAVIWSCYGTVGLRSLE